MALGKARQHPCKEGYLQKGDPKKGLNLKMTLVVDHQHRSQTVMIAMTRPAYDSESLA
jgi:hypothetical protein